MGRNFMKSFITGMCFVVALLIIVFFLELIVFTKTVSARDKLAVALFVNGSLGDKSFFDSAQRGMVQLHQKLGLETRTIEAGHDPTHWEAALIDLADSGEYDIIITGTFTMVSYVEQIAQDYPDVKFVHFDGSVDYKTCSCENVYSILFKQNEASYLAGALAAMLISKGNNMTGNDLANMKDKIGFIGGMEIPVINDFLIGYQAGAKSILPNITVLTQYTNNFSDPAAGKEIALAQYNQNAAIIFAVAGGTGQGAMEAAAEKNRLIIGVDSDQTLIFSKSNPKIAKRIVTSVLKNVDTAIFNAIDRDLKGEKIFGRGEALGLKNGSVGLAINKITRSLVSKEILDKIQYLTSEIIDGRITVSSAF